jgi:hypothetical protein
MRALLPALLACAACGPSVPECMEALPRTEAEDEAIRAAIRSELGEAFRVERVEDCFWIATDDGPASLASYRATVERMVRHLYADFFSRRPDLPHRIYLFRDKEGYDAYCWSVYARKPATPYGFYLSRERKMVINISTGTGTLAHEIVHPLLAADLPGAPSWFNEGFASLYERSTEEGGRMVGLVNWRLAALKVALREGTCLSLEELLPMGAERFYGDRRGVHYAAARFLCLWLQEQGRLTDFYRRLKSGFAEDPTGRSALVQACGANLADLEKEWREWALGLRRED